MKKLMLAGIIGATTMLFASGCSYELDLGDNLKEEEIRVKEDSAKELKIDLSIGAGELNVAGGAKEWVEGTVRYDNRRLKPQVDYDLDGKTGELEIKQSQGRFTKWKLGDMTNIWDVELTDEVPIDLNIDAGASDTKLDLRGLQLSKLDIDAGVGDMEIDLSGDWDQSFDADIEMGVGSSTIILPKNVGVKIRSSKGIGSSDIKGLSKEGNGVYTNEAYEKSDVIINIQTEHGVGDVTFKVED